LAIVARGKQYFCHYSEQNIHLTDLIMNIISIYKIFS